jgi:Mn2+/Fe2+ NRAMP family transporter
MMNIPVQYVLGAILLVAGLVTAWAGPYATDEDNRTGERTPQERRRIRWFGLAIAVCGVAVLIATLLGFRAKQGGDGPLI